MHDPIIEPHDPPPRIDARAWAPLILKAAPWLLRSALRPRLAPPLMGRCRDHVATTTSA